MYSRPVSQTQDKRQHWKCHTVWYREPPPYLHLGLGVALSKDPQCPEQRDEPHSKPDRVASVEDSRQRDRQGGWRYTRTDWKRQDIQRPCAREHLSRCSHTSPGVRQERA